MKNSELWLQMAPASAVCGELGLPSLERVSLFALSLPCVRVSSRGRKKDARGPGKIFRGPEKDPGSRCFGVEEDCSK